MLSYLDFGVACHCNWTEDAKKTIHFPFRTILTIRLGIRNAVKRAWKHPGLLRKTKWGRKCGRYGINLEKNILLLASSFGFRILGTEFSIELSKHFQPVRLNPNFTWNGIMTTTPSPNTSIIEPLIVLKRSNPHSEKDSTHSALK